MFKLYDMAHLQVLETEGPQPVLYADWLHAAGKPTILVYGHYDVQVCVFLLDKPTLKKNFACVKHSTGQEQEQQQQQ
jgi:hypothetical protein